MKTLFSALLALGFITSAANAQYCNPGYGHRGYHKPVTKVVKEGEEKPVEAAPAPVPVPAPVAPVPSPAPQR